MHINMVVDQVITDVPGTEFLCYADRPITSVNTTMDKGLGKSIIALQPFFPEFLNN